MHGLDYDDTHIAGVVHLTVSVLPAVLSLTAERHGASAARCCSPPISPASKPARASPASSRAGCTRWASIPPAWSAPSPARVGAGKLIEAAPERTGGRAGHRAVARERQPAVPRGRLVDQAPAPGLGRRLRHHRGTLAEDDIPAPTAAYEGRFGLYRAIRRPPSWRPCDISIATRRPRHRLGDRHVAVKPFPVCHFVHACADAAIALHGEGVPSATGRSHSRAGAVPARCRRCANRSPQAPAEQRLRRQVQHALRGRERPGARPARTAGTVACGLHRAAQRRR